MTQPHDLNAEREVLGAALVTNRFQAIWETGLTPEDFYLDSHSALYATMRSVHLQGKPVDELTVAAADPNMRPVLEPLITPTAPHNAVAHAEIVRRKASWRRRYDAAMAMWEAAGDEDTERYTAAESLLDVALPERGEFYSVEDKMDLAYGAIEGELKPDFYWPFKALNEAQSGGMRCGNLIVVAGYTGEGKSHFCDMILDDNVGRGNICLYDNEMNAQERTIRATQRSTGLSTAAITDADEETSKRVLEYVKTRNSDNDWPIQTIAGWSAQEVCSDIRQKGWDLVVVDILHNFQFKDERELSSIVSQLKSVAMRANCVVILAAHVNRGGIEAGKRKRPTRSSLRWSGDIENLADVVCFVWREQDDELETTYDGHIYFDKCRGGRTWNVPVEFDPKYLIFRERSLNPLRVIAA